MPDPTSLSSQMQSLANGNLSANNVGTLILLDELDKTNNKQITYHQSVSRPVSTKELMEAFGIFILGIYVFILLCSSYLKIKNRKFL